MENQIVITSGKKYIDIDGYAGIFAYRELLRHLGYQAYAYTSAKTNESVPELIKQFPFTFDQVSFEKPTKYVVLDVSNPDFLEERVKLEDIIEVIDHHTGFEEYWKERGTNHIIEFIGSICTIIFELYEKNHLESTLSEDMCKLLMAGILDNTLNLKSTITTKRDIDCYHKLQKIGKVDERWREEYFEACYGNLENHLEESLKEDIKVEKVSSYLPETIGQIIVLSKDTVWKQLDVVHRVFDVNPSWLLNVICLEDGNSYLFYGGEYKELLEELFGVPEQKQCLTIHPFLLRKQIMKKAREFDQKKTSLN